MKRRVYLATVGATAGGSAFAGCAGDGDNPEEGNGGRTTTGGDSGDDTATFEVAYNYRRYDAVPKQNGDGRWQSDGQTQYVGVEVRVTNPASEERSIDDAELWVLADGSSQGVGLVTDQSETGALTAIDAGETVAAWLLFSAPADADVGFGESRYADLSYEFRRDESIEMPRFENGNR